MQIDLYSNQLSSIQINWSLFKSIDFKSIDLYSNQLICIQINWSIFKSIDLYSNQLISIPINRSLFKSIDLYSNQFYVPNNIICILIALTFFWLPHIIEKTQNGITRFKTCKKITEKSLKRKFFKTHN